MHKPSQEKSSSAKGARPRAMSPSEREDRQRKLKAVSPTPSMSKLPRKSPDIVRPSGTKFRGDKITRTRFEMLLGWVNSLQISPTRIDDVDQLCNMYHDGLFLCNFVELMHPGMRLLAVHNKVTTPTLALQNTKKATEIIWKYNPRLKNMPTDQQIVDGDRLYMLTFTNELFEIFEVRDIKHRLRHMISWCNKVLRQYGKILYMGPASDVHEEDCFSGELDDALWESFRDGCALACICHYHLEEKPNIKQLFFSPQTMAEGRSNVNFMLQCLTKADIPLVFTVDEFLVSHDTGFLLYLVDLVYWRFQGSESHFDRNSPPVSPTGASGSSRRRTRSRLSPFGDLSDDGSQGSGSPRRGRSSSPSISFNLGGQRRSTLSRSVVEPMKPAKDRAWRVGGSIRVIPRSPSPRSGGASSRGSVTSSMAAADLFDGVPVLPEQAALFRDSDRVQKLVQHHKEKIKTEEKRRKESMEVERIKANREKVLQQDKVRKMTKAQLEAAHQRFMENREPWYPPKPYTTRAGADFGQVLGEENDEGLGRSEWFKTSPGKTLKFAKHLNQTAIATGGPIASPPTSASPTSPTTNSKKSPRENASEAVQKPKPNKDNPSGTMPLSFTFSPKLNRNTRSPSPRSRPLSPRPKQQSAARPNSATKFDLSSDKMRGQFQSAALSTGSRGRHWSPQQEEERGREPSPDDQTEAQLLEKMNALKSDLHHAALQKRREERGMRPLKKGPHTARSKTPPKSNDKFLRLKQEIQASREENGVLELPDNRKTEMEGDEGHVQHLQDKSTVQQFHFEDGDEPSQIHLQEPSQSPPRQYEVDDTDELFAKSPPKAWVPPANKGPLDAVQRMERHEDDNVSEISDANMSLSNIHEAHEIPIVRKYVGVIQVPADSEGKPLPMPKSIVLKQPTQLSKFQALCLDTWDGQALGEKNHSDNATTVQASLDVELVAVTICQHTVSSFNNIRAVGIQEIDGRSELTVFVETAIQPPYPQQGEENLMGLSTFTAAVIPRVDGRVKFVSRKKGFGGKGGRDVSPARGASERQWLKEQQNNATKSALERQNSAGREGEHNKLDESFGATQALHSATSEDDRQRYPVPKPKPEPEQEQEEAKGEPIATPVPNPNLAKVEQLIRSKADIQVKVVEATNLQSSGPARCNAFCTMFVGPNSYTTRVVPRTIHPKWSQMFELQLDLQHYSDYVALFQVQDQDEAQVIGECSVELNTLDLVRSNVLWLPLSPSGEIHVEIDVIWKAIDGSVLPKHDVQKISMALRENVASRKNEAEEAEARLHALEKHVESEKAEARLSKRSPRPEPQMEEESVRLDEEKLVQILQEKSRGSKENEEDEEEARRRRRERKERRKSRERSDSKGRDRSDSKGRDRSDSKGRDRSDSKGRDRSDSKGRDRSESRTRSKSKDREGSRRSQPKPKK